MNPNLEVSNPTGSVSEVDALTLKIRELESLKRPYSPDDWYLPKRSQYLTRSYLDQTPKQLGLPNGNQRLRFFDPSKTLPNGIVNVLVKKYLSQGLLSRPLALKLLSAPLGTLLLHERMWLSLEDNLLFSSPEAFACKDLHWWVKRFFRFTAGLLAYGGTTTFFRILKQGLLHLENKCLRKKTHENVSLPGCWPGSITENGKSVLGHGPSWLLNLYRVGPTNKSDLTRLAHFISTRNFPPPRREDGKVALVKHHKVLTRVQDTITPQRLCIVRSLGRRIGNRVDKRSVAKAVDRPEHLSSTNRSSFCYSRGDGGRAFEVQVELEKWANTPGRPGRIQPVWGPEIDQKGDRPRWKDFIIHPLRVGEEEHEFLDLYQSTIGTQSHAGLNRNLGLQLLQCAFEEGVKRGIFTEDFQLGTELSYVRTSVCGEPGLKSRIYTISEWFITIFLQPLGHLLVTTLETIPQARAGLKAASPAWEWVNDFKYKADYLNPLLKSLSLLTSDLEAATDYCHHKVCREMLLGYLEGLGLQDNRYLNLAVLTLTSPRMLITQKPL